MKRISFFAEFNSSTNFSCLCLLKELIIKQNMIKTAAELDHIIRDIASILDIEKGSIQHFSPINVSEEVNHILDRLQRDLDDFGIILEKSIEVKDTFSTIPPYFSSIIYNLISNAIKYRKINDETCRVSIQVDVTAERAVIEFKDNGIGISQENLNRIFEMFYRASEQSEGSGLGLYIVHKIVNAHHGDIKISDNPGGGTIFTITFPKINLL